MDTIVTHSVEVKKIFGKPKYIDKIDDENILFEMWTYPIEAHVSRLYFENDILNKIDY